jgi:2-polyprenyl-6-methoxyphenol hydroxylase-like FAD-dependent oxidoreductase
MRWTVGRVTLLGYAAHAMLPYMALGAVQAIEDAAVPARCLERAGGHELAPAMRRYEETRKPRATPGQGGSRRNGEMYHLADGEQQQLRDVSLGSATTPPLYRRTSGCTATMSKPSFWFHRLSARQRLLSRPFPVADLERVTADIAGFPIR